MSNKNSWIKKKLKNIIILLVHTCLLRHTRWELMAARTVGE